MALAKKLNTESKVKENQVIDEEIVMRNTIESFHGAVSLRLSSSLTLKRDLPEGRKDGSNDSSYESSISESKDSSKASEKELDKDVARSE